MKHHNPNDIKNTGVTTIVCTGDVILDVPEPDHWLAGIAAELGRADYCIGHLEVPHSDSIEESSADVPAPAANPAYLAALQRAGFDAMTLAGNHIADCGAVGIIDTIAELYRLGIGHCGAGINIDAARQPLLTDIGGRVVALLSYNCVGPESGWATNDKAGCSYLPVATADGSPVVPAAPLTHATGTALSILSGDIGKIRKEAGLVIVALHKGIVHTPAVISDYEFELAHAAIDAGADVVVSHHAHIVRGIEYYRGKPIFHGLGNGCVVTRALSPDQSHPGRAAWAEKRKKLFGFEPDPAFTLAPFHPEAVNAFMAKLLWYADGTLKVGIIPVHVDAPGRPRLADAAESVGICRYVNDITRKAGLPALNIKIQSDMVCV